MIGAIGLLAGLLQAGPGLAAALKVNQVSLSQWLEDRGYAGSGGGEMRTAWYDDVVVATSYIGPKIPKR